jgi:hypothetical protein
MFGVIAFTIPLFAASLLAMPVLTVFAQEGMPPAEQQALPTTGEKEGITLEGMSTEGSIVVTVNWTPADIGQPNTFSLVFANPDGSPTSPIYSVELLQNNQTVPGTLRQEQTSSVQQYTFNQTGSYTLKIHDLQDRRATDVINIPLMVPPESPPATFNNTTAASNSSGMQSVQLGQSSKPCP